MCKLSEQNRLNNLFPVAQTVLLRQFAHTSSGPLGNGTLFTLQTRVQTASLIGLTCLTSPFRISGQHNAPTFRNQHRRFGLLKFIICSQILSLAWQGQQCYLVWVQLLRWNLAWSCCHTEIEVADQTFYPTQSQYTDTQHWPYDARRLAG